MARVPEAWIVLILQERCAHLPLRPHHGINVQQVLCTKGDMHEGLDKVDGYLHEGKVAARHHLFQHRVDWEPEPGLIGQPGTNQDIIPIALD